MRQIHSQNIRQTSRSTSGGLAPIALGLLAGVAWGLKSHGNDRHPTSEEKSSDTPWMAGVLGAGLAGVALGVSRKKTERFDARGQSDVRLSSQATVNRPPEVVYRYWEDVRNLPRVMSFIESVEPQEGNISHWVARVPTGPTVEWDAEMIAEKPGRQLAWHSLEGSELHTWGKVTFTPSKDGQGTEVAVAFNFNPPDNVTGATARFLSSVESAALEHDLSQLKVELETQALRHAH